MKEKHSTASVYIFNSSNSVWRLLLVHHKKFNRWMVPGGHVENFENHYEAVLREAKEETGLDIEMVTLGIPGEPKLQVFSDAREMFVPSAILEEDIPEYKGKQEHYHIDFLYTAISKQDKLVLADREAHEIRWFTKEELNGLDLFESTKHFASRFFGMIEEEYPLH